MLKSFYISGNWVSDGVFAALAPNIKINSEPLLNFVKQVKESLMIEVVLDGVVDHSDLTAYNFAGNKVPVHCQKSYIDLLTSGHPEEYQFKYVPEHKLICIFDEDGTIGFVMRLKNQDEE